MNAGQIFTPFGVLHGLFIPNALARNPKLTAVDKLVYGRLCQYAGKDGIAFPKQETLADEVGVSERHTRRSIGRLCQLGFLQRSVPDGKDRLMHKSNRYQFIWHETFDELSEIAPPGRTPVSSPRGGHRCPPQLKRIRGKENQSSKDDPATPGVHSPRYMVEYGRSAKRLGIAIQKEHGSSPAPGQTAKWAKELSQLAFLHKISKQRITKAVRWYCQHLPKKTKFTPIIRNAWEFSKKFLTVEKAMNDSLRASPRSPRDWLGSTSFDIPGKKYI
jgi:hypothetical protein